MPSFPRYVLGTCIISKIFNNQQVVDLVHRWLGQVNRLDEYKNHTTTQCHTVPFDSFNQMCCFSKYQTSVVGVGGWLGMGVEFGRFSWQSRKVSIKLPRLAVIHDRAEKCPYNCWGLQFSKHREAISEKCPQNCQGWQFYGHQEAISEKCP